MDIYELLKACNISLIEIDGKPEIAEQLTVKDCKKLLKKISSQIQQKDKTMQE